MKARIPLTAAVLAVLAAPAAAPAEGLAGKFTIAIQVGTQSELGGDLLKAADGLLIGKPVTFGSQRYRDVYAPDLRVQGLVGYGLNERVEIVSRATWYEAEGTTIEGGTFDGKPLFVFFEPLGAYEEVGLEVALRVYISAAGRLKSYIAPVVGARWTKDVLVSFSVPEAGSSVQNVPLLEKSTVPVFGLDLGFSFDLGGHLFIGIDTGLRYQSAPSPSDLLPGLTRINDADARWSAPVVASLGVRF
jgi:hypothetical protein